MTAPRYRGIVPPLVTPLSGPDALDERGLERLIAHVIGGGVTGLFVLGTTGEGPSLSHRLQRATVTAACGFANHKVPVLVGISDTSCAESIALAQFAADAGADAVVIAPPYYFPAGQTELEQYVRWLCDRVPLPVMLYNMPQLTKVEFDIDTLARLSDIDRIVGVKDSGGNLDYFRGVVNLKSQRPDWSVLIGPEALLPQAMLAGGDGGVSGGANIVPKLFTRLFTALDTGDAAAVSRLSDQVQRLQAIYDIGKYASRHIKATKSALAIRNICSDSMAQPFNAFLPPERDRVAAVLETLDQARCW